MPHNIPANREQVQKPDLGNFDYGAPAELYQTGNKKFTTKRYRRFDTAAEAVRFAIEKIPAPALCGACMEVDEARFDVREIGLLYEGAAFPLARGRRVK
jgi:hypothetical protein